MDLDRAALAYVGIGLAGLVAVATLLEPGASEAPIAGPVAFDPYYAGFFAAVLLLAWGGATAAGLDAEWLGLGGAGD